MKKIFLAIVMICTCGAMMAEVAFTAKATLKLTSEQGAKDAVYLYESSEFTAADDGVVGGIQYDVTKIPNDVESVSKVVNFYAIASWGDAASVGENTLEGLKLKFQANRKEGDVYTITFSDVMGTPYYLKDNMVKGADENDSLTAIVAGGTYSFTQAVSTTEERFEIVAAPLAPLTFINNVLVINEATAGAEVSVTPFSYVNGERVMAAGLAPLTAPVNEAFPADTYGYLLVEYTNAEGVARKFIINANPDVAPAND